MRKVILIIIGSILGLWAIAFVLSFWLQNTSFNPFASRYNISGKIINYDSNNLGDQFPLEVVLGIYTGNPMQWDEKKRYLIFKVEADGSFKLKNVNGYKLKLRFRSVDYSYTFGEIMNKDNNLSIDLLKLEKNKRDFSWENINKDLFVYKN